MRTHTSDIDFCLACSSLQVHCMRTHKHAHLRAKDTLPHSLCWVKKLKAGILCGQQEQEERLVSSVRVQTLAKDNYSFSFQQQSVFRHTLSEGSAHWIIQASKGVPPCHRLSFSHKHTTQWGVLNHSKALKWFLSCVGLTQNIADFGVSETT